MTQSVAVAIDIFQLDAAAEDEQVAGAHQPERVNAWISELHQRDAQGRFFAALGGFLVSARVS
jgi:drug/metabolite transporter superfamily protein YnfA